MGLGVKLYWILYTMLSKYENLIDPEKEQTPTRIINFTRQSNYNQDLSRKTDILCKFG